MAITRKSYSLAQIELRGQADQTPLVRIVIKNRGADKQQANLRILISYPGERFDQIVLAFPRSQSSEVADQQMIRGDAQLTANARAIESGTIEARIDAVVNDR